MDGGMTGKLNASTACWWWWQKNVIRKQLVCFDFCKILLVHYCAPFYDKDLEFLSSHP